jgi:hypothetical protein
MNIDIGDKVYSPLFDKVFEVLDIDDWPHDSVVGMRQLMLYCTDDPEAHTLDCIAFKPFEVEKL